MKKNNEKTQAIKKLAISTDCATLAEHYQRCVDKDTNDIIQMDFDLFDNILDNYDYAKLSDEEIRIYNEMLELKFMLADKFIIDEDNDNVKLSFTDYADMLNYYITQMQDNMGSIQNSIQSIIENQNKMLNKLDTL